MKQKAVARKAIRHSRHHHRPAAAAGSIIALEFFNVGSIYFGSTAGSSALVAKINRNPIESITIHSRPAWTALVATRNLNMAIVADLKGKRQQ